MSVIIVAGLLVPGAKVEIEGTAVLDPKAKPAAAKRKKSKK
jgi:hypothetical protein